MSQDSTRLKILFLEDQLSRIELIRAAFAQSGSACKLDFVSSSKETLQAVRRETVNILFFNDTLAGGNTAKFIGEINTCSVGALAIIRMAADGAEETALRPIADGADESVSVDSESIRRYPQFAARAHARAARLQDGRHILRNLHWQAVVGSLVPGVGHELNNPLTGTIAYTELLLQQTVDETVRQDLNKILKSAVQCKAIVENLLSFARQRTSEKSLSSVNEVIDRTIELRNYGLRSRSITVIKDYGELPAAFGDRQLLQQVILHLVMNAEQAIAAGGPARGEITIATRYRKEDRAVLISIADNGPAIAPAVFARIFEPFFSTNPARSGLGLSESRRIIAAQGGTLQAAQRAGGGVIFTIELPTRGPAGENSCVKV